MNENDKYFFHVSKKPNLKTLKPKIPDNKMTRDFGENNTIPRISVCKNINQCMSALYGMYDFNESLYVYLVYCENSYYPSRKLVPDGRFNEEYWVLEETECEMLYEIKRIKEIPYGKER